MRILFVDDEIKVLDGIRRALFALDEEDWEASFETNAHDGLSRLEEEAFDVVISDMRMPKMDGAAFLTEVHRRYPQIIRIILSGQSEEEAALRAAQVAHQFLSKPCKLEILRDIIHHISEMRQRIERDQVRALVGGIESFPPMPQVLQRLIELLDNPETSTKQIGGIIQQDIGMTTKLMQLANSSFFGRGVHTTDLNSAVQRIGLRLLRQIATSEAVFGSVREGVAPLDLLRLQEEATRRMMLVSRFLNTARGRELGTLAALVCDVGKLVMSSRSPTAYQEMISEMSSGKEEREVELAAFGCTHAEIGAYLLALWNLPPPVAEIVAYHHDLPEKTTPEVKEIVGAVNLACCLISNTKPNTDWFVKASLQDHLRQWIDLAKTIS